MQVFSVAGVQPSPTDPIVSPALMDPESTPGKKGKAAGGVEGFAEESFRHGLCSAEDQAMTTGIARRG
jgi:hypothetical protein